MPEKLPRLTAKEAEKNSIRFWLQLSQAKRKSSYLWESLKTNGNTFPSRQDLTP